MQPRQTVQAVNNRGSQQGTVPLSLATNWVTIAAIAGVGAIACLAVLWATARWGIGVAADSTVYIGAARSLLSQGSLLDVDSMGQPVPLVHYPPLLPLMLAALSWLFHVDPVAAARWLIAGLFGINVTLLGLATWRILNSPGLGLTSAFLALTLTPMVGLHQMTLSEPLYVCFAFSAFLLMLRHLKSPSLMWLTLAAVATALAFSTRYAGASLVLAGVGALLLLQRSKLGFAVLEALVFSAVSCLPVGAWLLRNHLVSGSASDFFNGKVFNLPASLDTILAGLNTASTWLFPGAVPSFARIAATVGLVLGLFAAHAYGVSRGRWTPMRDRLPAVVGIFVISNLAVLLATVLVLDGTTPLDDRLLLPSLAPLALLLFGTLHSAARGAGNVIRFLPAVFIGLLFLTNAPRSVSHLLTTARSGRGYNALEWQNSSLIGQLRATAGDVPIYSTLPSAIRFLTNQPVRQLPNTYNPRTERKNQSFEREMSSLARESQESGIALVYLKSGANQWYPAEAELVRTLDLTLRTSNAQGALYVSPRLAAGTRTAQAAAAH